MKTNKLPIRVRAKALIKSITAKENQIHRLTMRLMKIQNQCAHQSEKNTSAEKTHEVFFDCSECGCRLYLNK